MIGVKKLKNIVYADYSATTPLKKEVLDEMIPYLTEYYANPSSIYEPGIMARQEIEKSRENIANCISAKYAEEIYFTSGGSEADNMIIRGIAYANKCRGKHIITTKIEHNAVLNTCKALQKEGFDVTYLDVQANGIVNVKDVMKAIRDDTILISVMYVNNEIGTIQPIEEIGKIARFYDICFHTDAVQAVANIDIDVEAMCIDAMSISAHKIYGPKGVGVAYIRKDVKFEPLIYGGHQENGMRAGTENVAGIVGMSKAMSLIKENMKEYNAKLISCRNKFLDLIKELNVKINGDLINRLPGNINFSIPGLPCNSLITELYMNNICISNGSACNSVSAKPSHVLSSIGLTEDLINNSIRITFGDFTTYEDVLYIAEKLIKITKSLIT